MKYCLEQAEDSFDGNPSRNSLAPSILRWHEFPPANGFGGAFLQPQPDSLHDPNLRRASVRANQNSQRHFSL